MLMGKLPIFKKKSQTNKFPLPKAALNVQIIVETSRVVLEMKGNVKRSRRRQQRQQQHQQRQQQHQQQHQQRRQRHTRDKFTRAEQPL